MKLPTMLQIGKGTAFFREYKQMQLWYNLQWQDEKNQLQELLFPIPVIDAGDGAFVQSMKGLHIIRWARKYIDYVAEAQRTVPIE